MIAVLESLDLVNFQSLKKTSVNLHPYFNVIVGPSNLGKSALLRAIRALARNAPTPGLLREGTTNFEITAQFADGVKEKLRKGKNLSEFIVEKDGEDWKNAKSGVKAPDEITALWALPAPDGREIALATQHEAPFLLDEPASAVAKVLGDLTNASKLMEAVARANKLRTAYLADEKARRREADEAAEALSEHDDLDVRAEAVAAAREAFTRTRSAVSSVYALRELQQQYVDTKTQLAKSQLISDNHVQLLGAFKKVEQAGKLYTDLCDLLSTYDTAVGEYNTVSESVVRDSKQVKHIQDQITQLMHEAGVCPLCNRALS